MIPGAYSPLIMSVQGHRYWKFIFSAVLSGLYVELNEITMRETGVNKIPLMTGQTTGGVTITADSYSATLDPWKVGDGDASNNANAWASISAVPQGLYIDFGNKVDIRAYSLTARNITSTYRPKDWVLYWSDDGVTYSAADTRSGESFAQGETKNYSF